MYHVILISIKNVHTNFPKCVDGIYVSFLKIYFNCVKAKVNYGLVIFNILRLIDKVIGFLTDC